MKTKSIFGLSILICAASGCGGGQTPAEFYIQVEQEWCQGHTKQEMMAEYYYPDYDTKRFVNLIGSTFENPSAAVRSECANFDEDRSLSETQTREIGEGRYAVYGQTINGSFEQISYQFIVETDSGYLIKFEP